MKTENRCAHCRQVFVPNPRVKNQKYCGRQICQNARKAKWQRQKMALDSGYYVAVINGNIEFAEDVKINLIVSRR